MSKEKANMRIVCKTKRAYDNALAIANFYGYDYGRTNKSKKTIELLERDVHFSRLIDTIHKQFSEELGERAWREEIDIFGINKGGNDYRIEKNPKKEKPEKRVIHLIVGELASEHANDIDELLEDLANYEGAYLVREFKTIDEENAYFQALEDLDGWNGFTTLGEHLDENEIKEFVKRYDETMEDEDA